MALNTGIVVTLGTSASKPLKNDLAIAIFGTCSTGTIAAGVLTKVQTVDQATALLGAGSATDTLPRAVGVLQRYGCGNIIACKLTGADTATQEADLIAKLDLLPAALSTVGVQPRVIVFPSFGSEASITKAIAIATRIYAVAIVNFPPGTTATAAVGARAGATGLGQKNQRLIVCHGHLKNATTPTTLESLKLHLTGVMANRRYGQSPLGGELLNVSGVDVPMIFGLSDEPSSPEMLNDAGVVSVNLSPENKLVIWGTRNSTYQESPPLSKQDEALSLINAFRARDEIALLSRVRALKMLGRNSDYATAIALSQSYRDMLSAEVAAQNILGFSAIEIAPETDYSKQLIAHRLEFQIESPLQLINVTINIDTSTLVGG